MVYFMQPSNPLGLVLGSKVNASRTCDVVYRDNDEKVLVYTGGAATGIVIGSKKKALGIYLRAMPWSGWGDEDYEEARLKVSEYIWLYQIKETWDSPVVYVHPDDIYN